MKAIDLTNSELFGFLKNLNLSLICCNVTKFVEKFHGIFCKKNMQILSFLTFDFKAQAVSKLSKFFFLIKKLLNVTVN